VAEFDFSCDEIFAELQEIGKLIDSANLITAIRKEVAKVKKEGVIVTDGVHQGGVEWDAVVKMKGGDCDKIARRLRSEMTNVEVESIANNVLGVRTARRGG